MTNLFQTVATGNAGALGKTAELTAVCENIAREIMNTISSKLDSNEVAVAALKAELSTTTEEAAKEIINAQITDTQDETAEIYRAVEDSKASHDSMDKLIYSQYDMESVDTAFLKTESDDTIDKMIKSQQSKRSRSKAKAMTQENYNTMMVGALAENLLRLTSGKPKTSHGGSSNSKPLEYDDAKLQEYKNNKELLNKEIRNIQSKKSIMKSKAGFDEASDGYIKLLEAEAMLKSLRGDAVATVKEVVPEYVAPLVEAKKFVDDEIATLDISKISNKDAKQLLVQMVAMMSEIAIDVVVDEPTEETDAE